MTRRLALLLVVLPLVAQARNQRGQRQPRTHETRCGRSCPQDMHADHFLEDAALCGASENHQFNAVVCKVNAGDGFVACGADCGWSYAEDRALAQRAACGLDAKTPGPAVSCKAFGVAKSKD